MPRTIADVVVAGDVVDAGTRAGAVDHVAGEVDRDAGRADDEARARAVQQVGAEPDVGRDDRAAGERRSGSGGRRRGCRDESGHDDGGDGGAACDGGGAKTVRVHAGIVEGPAPTALPATLTTP